MNYEKLAYAPEIELKKAYAYAEWIISLGEVIETVIPIRWEDGEIGFQFSILQNPAKGNMLNITTVTIERVNETPVSISEAADIYSIAYSTLAQAARERRIQARQSSKTWITTCKAIEDALDQGSLKRND